MGSILPVSLIAVIATFLLGILVQFPISGNVPDATSQNGSSTDTVRQVADRFSLVYVGVVNDLISFQKDPDYQRADASRQKMTGYAQGLLPQYQAFIDQMQSKLGELTSQYTAETMTTTETTTTTTTP